MENLNQIFEDSRQTADDYLAYLTRRGGQQAKESIYSLNSIVENINMAGMVAAMAAQESMASHNSIFQMLYAINQAQGALMDLVIDLRLNGGAGGGDGGGMVGGAATAGGAASALGVPPKLVALAAVLGGVSSVTGSKEIKQAELSHPNSLTNKAKKAQGDAHQLIGTINYSVNPAPNPAVNGPGAFMDGNMRASLPFAPTVADVASLMDATREGILAAGEAKQVQERWWNIEKAKNRGNALNESARERIAQRAVSNPATGVDESTSYNLQAHAAAMPPQPAQVIVQAAPSAEPNQTITIHMNNEIKGAIYDARAFKDLSDYLVERLREQFNRRGVRYSNNW